MTLIRFEPLRELENWNERIHRLFGEFPSSTEFEKGFNPQINISDDEKYFYLEAEIPGVKKDDIKISLHDNILTISGEKKTDIDREDKNKNFYRTERSYGVFSRSFTLPEEVNSEACEAKFEDGILKVTIEKASRKAVNERFINIK